MSITKKSIADYLSQVAGFLVSFVAGLLVSRYFAPAGRGEYTLILLANLLLINFTNLGVEISSRVFSGKHRDKIAEIHTAGILIILAVCVLLTVSLFLFQESLRNLFFAQIPPKLLLLSACLLPFSLYQVLWQGIIIGLGDVYTYVRVSMWNRIIQAGVVIILITFFTPQISWLIVSWVMIQIITVVVIFYLLRGKSKLFAPVSLALIKKILNFGWIVYLGNVAATLLQKFDSLIVSKLTGNEGVGLYSQATMFSDKITLVAGAMERATYSPVSQSNHVEAVKLIEKTFRNSFFIHILAILATYPFASLCIHLLLPDFIQSLAPLKFLLLTVLFMGCSRILSIYFTAHLAKPNIPGIINWVVLPLHISLCFFLTKKFGITGASAATALTYFIQAILFYLTYRHYSGSRSFLAMIIPTREDLQRFKSLWKLFHRETL